ncbi:hypothetical protein BDW62DRAFT_189196 [Aspergillus aurantiobrunneus]
MSWNNLPANVCHCQDPDREPTCAEQGRAGQLLGRWLSLSCSPAILSRTSSFFFILFLRDRKLDRSKLKCLGRRRRRSSSQFPTHHWAPPPPLLLPSSFRPSLQPSFTLS